MKKKKRKLFAELADLHRGAGEIPRCPYFGSCGGCLFQDIPYQGQLLLKRDYLNGIFDGLLSVDEVRPSGPYRYRNRMDMVTAFGRMGLRRQGSHKQVVDIVSCAIMQERSDSLMKEVRPLVAGVEDYDYLVHSGYLRYVVFRQAAFTGQCMVNFVVAADDGRIDAVASETARMADSVSVILSAGLADLSFGPVLRDVKAGCIAEEFDGVRFRIAPNSFFQSNSAVALSMYRRIRECVKGRVLDLYSGVGAISLFVAPAAETVTGVEEVSEAVSMAGLNRDDNGCGNVSFVCADVRAYLKEAAPECDTLILDPPRSGMHPKVIKRINEMRPERIIYMSCNPAAFRLELDSLEGYRVELFEAYDMFPQTPHVETLALLERR